MQKIGKFCNTGLIFLPAILLMAFSGRWLGLAVGALSPARALEFMKNGYGESAIFQSAANPFSDFSFENLFNKENDEPVSAVYSEAYNPNYSVIEEFMGSSESDIVLKKDSCYVKNLTHLSATEVKNIMLSPVGFEVEKNSDRPQILIYHTHATESYVPTSDMAYDPAYAYRSTDTAMNMVAVGKVMADTLNSMGYNTIQDSTLHDYPSYNGSYDLSKATVESYLKKYPSIKIVLDIHRDAVERNGRLVNPTVTINGTKYAQIMIISGRDNGYMNMPNYRENLKFASAVQNQVTKSYPGLARPILFDYRNYNQQLTTGSILVEIGTHGSTLQQAKNSAQAFATALAQMLDGM